MALNRDSTDTVGIRFFGKVTASVTHEIKNALAVINENAGLLEDLTVMSDRGVPIDPERLKVMAKKILTQVQRVDGIVKNMNGFAHSVDEDEKCIDLAELLNLVIRLAGRHAAMRGVSLEMAPVDGAVMVTTVPFALENLVWLCLEYAMGVCGNGKRICLIPEKTTTGARIRITRLESLSAGTADPFPTERETSLSGVIGADLALDAVAGEITVTLLPKPGAAAG
mgnify:CR=1 FL=1